MEKRETKIYKLAKTRRTRLRPGGHLLILSCSKRKRETQRAVPALHLYDGVNFRVLRKFLLEAGWPPGLRVKILSARYGLIDATEIIEPYDLYLDKETAARKNKTTLTELKDIYRPSSVFVNLGANYLPAIKGIERVFPNSNIKYARGGIGVKMTALKKWLERLPRGTSDVKGHKGVKRSYLYIFPDWDDYIYEPFKAEPAGGGKGKKTYAYEACGKRIPFDGVLLSLSQLRSRKGALHRFKDGDGEPIPLRKELRIPKKILLFGDCGAFSYAAEDAPPFTPEEAAALYHQYGFDIGASVDHIPLPAIKARKADGTTVSEPLSESRRYRRMYLTRDNAADFISVCRSKKYGFAPLGVIQGLGVKSYVARLREYVKMGYEHIALGGLVPRTDDDIIRILCAVRREVQVLTAGRKSNLWVHLFGILRPNIQTVFKELGVSSFDSASYFRKAWLRSDQNYLAPDASKWYGTIRVPISTSKAMIAGADSKRKQARLPRMEKAVLNAIDSYHRTGRAPKYFLDNINKYSALLIRKSEDNHFDAKHKNLLKKKPWKACSCPFCKKVGIHVVVFRGANRNKRRGLHNTWVFYNRVLRDKAIK